MRISNSSRAQTRSTKRHQQGVVLIFALIALGIMLLGAVALISSFNTTLVAAGNIGFKRDLQNQSERAFSQVFAEFSSGALATSALRANNKATQNYSAVALATNAQGIPLALLDNSVFSSSPLNFTMPDINIPGRQITIRYVVDRLCPPSAAGRSAQSLAPGVCIAGSGNTLFGKDESHTSGDDASRSDSDRAVGAGGTGPGESGVRKPVAYRITARVSGPRNIESFFQTTFSEPL
jgi:type IV pilus assembly protein PilX